MLTDDQTSVSDRPPSDADSLAERTRCLALMDLDSTSRISPAVRAAIESGESMGQFAISLALRSRAASRRH